MKIDSELISVIMGVYNSEETLEEAIESILNQSYQNIEIVVCDDGSTDSSLSILKRYKKNNSNKIILLENGHNQGLNYTLNKCLQASKGELIARMDADDISMKDRLFKQYEFLMNNPKYSIVSTQMLYFDDRGVYGKSAPVEVPTYKTFLLETTPFAHAAALVRRSAYQSVGGYTEDNRIMRVEDLHLWFKMYANGLIGYNILEPLYMMRNDKNAISRREFKYRLNESYVKMLALQSFKLPLWYYVYVLIPIIKGLIPKTFYKIIHFNRIRGQSKT